MDNREERIKLLSRINRARISAPALLATLSDILGEALDESALLLASDSDAVQQVFRTDYQTVTQLAKGHYYRRSFSTTQQTQIFAFAECLAQKFAGERAFFIAKTGKDTAVINLSVSLLLKHVASVIRFDGDSLAVLSEDHKQGVLIDHNPNDLERLYDVTIWGESWSQLAQPCDRPESNYTGHD